METSEHTYKNEILMNSVGKQFCNKNKKMVSEKYELTYKSNKNESCIKILGKQFVDQYKNLGSIIYNNKLYPLSYKFDKKLIIDNEMEIKIKIIFKEIIYDKSYMFEDTPLKSFSMSKIEPSKTLYEEQNNSIDCNIEDINNHKNNLFENLNVQYKDEEENSIKSTNIKSNSNFSQISLIDNTKKNKQNYLTGIAGMFYNCSSLKFISDISNWNTENVTDMREIFCNCSSLEYLPDISNWNTRNVTNMNGLFFDCSNLKSLPDISKWDISNVTDLSGIFFGCSSLNSLPDLSKWNISKNKVMISIFNGCTSLKLLPDISNWKTNNVIIMSRMFYNCSSLSTLPDIFKWNISKLKTLNEMFVGTKFESNPELSEWNQNRILMINK